MKKAIMFSLLMFAVSMVSSRAEAQFADYRTVTQLECWVSTITPTLCIDLSSAPYSRLVFGSYMIYGDTTTLDAIIRVGQSSATLAAVGIPLEDEKIKWTSFDQSQLIFKDKIWAFAQEAVIPVKLLIGVGRP